MKRWKQTLALLLCAVLCFTTLSASAFAAENWPEKTDPIAACFTSGSRDSATSTGKFPEYLDTVQRCAGHQRNRLGIECQ